VFKYKYDTDGYLVKFKARICVRGDLQITRDNNYAATLAVRVFRALMALAAAFDLEILQLDAVNAFLNSKLAEHITVEWPPGFRQNNRVLKLLKALYGLKQAPVLWYNHLVAMLLQQGLQKVHGVNCVLTTNWLILFFYVDDIILLYSQENQERVNTLLTQLKDRLELRELQQANWFLGIRILRDRGKRKLWLCQDSYIDKITARFNVNPSARPLAYTPLPGELPGPYEGVATPSDIYGFGSRIGSANFAAVTTRPDIAKACSILAQYLCNPGPEHLRAADRILSYLARTKFYAIEYGLREQEDDETMNHPFCCYSDSAFADNLDRKSSDGYLFTLYGGPVDWKASKQETVTTSSTEAELLALSRTAKELMAWKRLFDRLSYCMDGGMKIYADNQQTIRLLKAQEPLLTTRLKHVDVHDSLSNGSSSNSI
jgi:reverse transcriptase-like protein